MMVELPHCQLCSMRLVVETASSKALARKRRRSRRREPRYGADPRGSALRLIVAELHGVVRAEHGAVRCLTGTLAFTLGLGLWQASIGHRHRRVPGRAPVALLATLGPKTGMGQLPLAGSHSARASRCRGGPMAECDRLGRPRRPVRCRGAQLLFHMPFAVGVLIVLVLEGLIGFLGYEVIHQLEKWGSAVLAVLFVILSVRILQRGHMPLHGTVHGGAAIGAFVLMTTIAFGGVFSWASYAADYSRYQRKETPSTPDLLVDLGRTEQLVHLDLCNRSGGRKSTEQPDGGWCASLVGGGAVGLLALSIVIFGAVTSNAMNDYSGSLALQAAGVRLKRNWSAVTWHGARVVVWSCGSTKGTHPRRFQSVLLVQRVLDCSVSRDRPCRLGPAQGQRLAHEASPRSWIRSNSTPGGPHS